MGEEQGRPLALGCRSVKHELEEFLGETLASGGLIGRDAGDSDGPAPAELQRRGCQDRDHSTRIEECPLASEIKERLGKENRMRALLIQLENSAEQTQKLLRFIGLDRADFLHGLAWAGSRRAGSSR